tara:strand:- start:1994 stop:2101 length:108 start_codon:yes stop_codon:yes gene_type:complete
LVFLPGLDPVLALLYGLAVPERAKFLAIPAEQPDA